MSNETLRDKTNCTLSVVLVTPDSFATIRKTVRHLSSQTVASQIELVLVAPHDCKLVFEASEISSFGHLRVEELNGSWLVARARALGAQRSSTRIVAFAEDHCFPESDWAQNIVTAFEASSCVAVGPLFLNANPATALSWADLLLNFGSWLDASQNGEMPFLAWHNTAYRREVLVDYGENLARLLEVEGALQDELRAQKQVLQFQPKARVRHLNPSRLGSSFTEHFHSGRLFGATRAQNWTTSRRVIYVVASPLIPFLRVRTATKHWRACTSLSPKQKRALQPRLFPALLLVAFCHTLGESVSYVFGVGDAAQRKSDMESKRERHLCRRDRESEASSTRNDALK